MSGIAPKRRLLAIGGAHHEGSRKRQRKPIGNRHRIVTYWWHESRHSSCMPMAELSIGLKPRRR